MNYNADSDCRRQWRVCILFTALVLVSSCTGPHLFVTCDNRTDRFGSFYLERTTSDDTFIEVIEPQGSDLIDVQTDGEFRWTLRLFDGSDEVFADSGTISIERDNQCIVENDTAGTYRVRWGE